jgi:hypothetical protein
MSRQKGSFGLSKLLTSARIKRSKTAGVNKYLPHSSEREIQRRQKQLAKGQIKETEE